MASAKNPNMSKSKAVTQMLIDQTIGNPIVQGVLEGIFAAPNMVSHMNTAGNTKDPATKEAAQKAAKKEAGNLAMDAMVGYGFSRVLKGLRGAKAIDDAIGQGAKIAEDVPYKQVSSEAYWSYGFADNLAVRGGYKVEKGVLTLDVNDFRKTLESVDGMEILTRKAESMAKEFGASKIEINFNNIINDRIYLNKTSKYADWAGEYGYKFSGEGSYGSDATWTKTID